MTTPIGRFSPAQLRQQVEEQAAQLKSSPRTEVPAALPGLRTLVAAIEQEAKRDASLHQSAVARYEQQLEAPTRETKDKVDALKADRKDRLGLFAAFGSKDAEKDAWRQLKAQQGALWAELVEPLEAEVEADAKVQEAAGALLAAAEKSAQPLEVRESYKSGIGAAYNEKTGQVEWKESYKDGVAGVYNPVKGEVEWKASYMDGVAGVWNPKAQRVEWKTSYMDGVGGVWNPKTEQVEWKTSYKDGVAGVWNPKTEQVEWKTSYQSGVAGYFDPKAGEVKWVDSYKSGVALAFNDGKKIHTSSGFAPCDD